MYHISSHPGRQVHARQGHRLECLVPGGVSPGYEAWALSSVAGGSRTGLKQGVALAT